MLETSSYLATLSCVTPYQASSVIKMPLSYFEKILYLWYQYLISQLEARSLNC